jgi:drug/metabolite transporter (DMT)-like permease
MIEPVAATLVAWLWLGEALGAAQLAGGGLVLAGIVLAQTAR